MSQNLENKKLFKTFFQNKQKKLNCKDILVIKLRKITKITKIQENLTPNDFN
jgi:hypothetical protein